MLIHLAVHSEVELITNSSTEMFVLRPDVEKTYDIRRFLQAWVDHYNKANDTQLTVDGILTVYVIDEDNRNNFQSRFDIYAPWYAADYKIKNGDIVIMGTDDNSIPWDVQEGIELIFDSLRLHLG